MKFKSDFALVLCTLTLFLSFVRYSFGASETDISRLRKDLLTGYDKNSRPIKNPQEWTTVVGISFVLNAFEVDERRSLLNLYCWTGFDWVDEHLHWVPQDYNNVTSVTFGNHELWKPDFTVYNNVDKSEMDHFGNSLIVVYSTSHVSWIPTTKFQVGCKTDLRKWPYDHQQCQIVIGSWTKDGLKLDLNISTIDSHNLDTAWLQQNREWDLVSSKLEKRVHYYECCPTTPYPDVVITLNLARRSSSHAACVVLPGFVIASSILIVFWISPGSIERLSIILIAILINVIYLYNIYCAIPNNGDTVPLVVLFYRDSLFMLAFALIWTICLRYLAATKRNSPVPLPSFIQGFLESVPAKILCLDSRPTTGGKGTNSAEATDNNDQNDAMEDTTPLGIKQNPFQEDWAWLAHLLDRVLFVIYLVVYLVMYIALL